MKLLCLLAQALEDSDSRFGWAIFAVLMIMAMCWYALSVTSREKTNSLWKDEGTKMDSTSDPSPGPGPP